MIDQDGTSAAPGYEDTERWNLVLFENASKLHLHQDNLRWTLAAGFAAFFFGGISIINHANIASNSPFVHFLQLALTLIGTAYYLLLMLEGWYYNMTLCYLIDCEKRIFRKIDLIPLAEYDRDKVSSFHPSFACVLFLAAVVNTFHLYEYTLTEFGRVCAMIVSPMYAGALFALGIFGKVPRMIDATIERMDRRRERVIASTVDTSPPTSQ